jgi:hypothetical protein
MPQLPTSTGPYVAVATFCDRVLQDADHVVSVIRAVDQLKIQATGPDPPAEMPPTPTNLTLVLILRRGTALGRQKVKIRPEAPGGIQLPIVAEVDVVFSGDEEAGANIFLDAINYAVDREGLWWFDVLFGDAETLLVRIPLRVVYLPQRTPQ